MLYNTRLDMLKVHLWSKEQTLNSKSCLLTGLPTLDILSERSFLFKLMYGYNRARKQGEKHSYLIISSLRVFMYAII